MKEWNSNEAEMAATRHGKVADKDDPETSTTGRLFVNTGAHVTAPIKPSVC